MWKKASLPAFILHSLWFLSLAFAQTNDEGLAFLQFNLVNPGARSVAMGGAFIAMADDATAAVSNPAGLTVLSKPELSAEFSSASFRNEIPWFEGKVTSGMDDILRTYVDFKFDFHPKDFPSNVQNLSFASFVYPFRLFERKLVLGGFYSQESKFEREYVTTGKYQVCNGFPPEGCAPTEIKGYPGDPGFRFSDSHSSVRFSLRNVGFSAGFQPSDRISVGLTLGYSRFAMESTTERLFEPTDIANPTSINSLTGRSGRFSYSVGGIYKVSKKVFAGGVYARRPTFDTTSSYYTRYTRLVGAQVSPQQFKLPDSFGLGVSVQPLGPLSVNVDVVRVLYSQLMEGYYNAFYHAKLEGGPFPSSQGPIYEKDGLEVVDGTEFHTGAEYVVFLGKVPLSIRSGFWREPFHSVTRKTEDGELEIPFEKGLGADARPVHSRSLIHDSNHISFGAGIVREAFSVDWGYDYSRDVKRFIISTTYYF